MAKDSRSSDVTTREEGIEILSAVLRNVNVPHVVIGSAPHQKRRVLRKDWGVKLTEAQLRLHPMDYHAGVSMHNTRCKQAGQQKPHNYANPET